MRGQQKKREEIELQKLLNKPPGSSFSAPLSQQRPQSWRPGWWRRRWWCRCVPPDRCVFDGIRFVLDGFSGLKESKKWDTIHEIYEMVTYYKLESSVRDFRQLRARPQCTRKHPCPQIATNGHVVLVRKSEEMVQLRWFTNKVTSKSCEKKVQHQLVDVVFPHQLLSSLGPGVIVPQLHQAFLPAADIVRATLPERKVWCGRVKAIGSIE